MEYAIVSVPAAPMRRKPRHQREMVSQLLFGEAVQVLREKGELWVKVQSLHDGYEGWMTRTLLAEVSENEAKSAAKAITTGFINTIQLNGQSMHLPMGASLPGLNNGKGKIGVLEYEYNGQATNPSIEKPGGELIESLARQWLNAPYCWGGRTLFGVDCSGFVQVNFKMMGIALPRDAWQQAQDGHTVKKLRDAQKGDLAFFDDKEEIVHVGILLDNEHIIHASGKVRVDAIDKKGIINSDTSARTHRLRAIKRFW